MSAARILIAFFSLVLATGLAHGQSLDGDTINRWANTMEELKGLDDERLDRDHGADMDMDMENPMDFEAAMAQSARENREVRRIIQRHGFRNGDEWANVGGRVTRAYSAMMMEQQAPEMDQEMQQQMRELENNPNIPEQQKAMIRQQMQAAQGMMQQMSDAPEEDIQAVRANRARLDQVFEDDN